MEIVVGKLAGFCGGVINSVTKALELLDQYDEMYCLGELVHNKQVVDKLEAKGLKVIENLDEVTAGDSVIIRAHGVPQDVYEDVLERNIKLIDLTCPKVLKIHKEAQKLAQEGYFIVLIAQKDHPEAIGTISFCGTNSVILETRDEIDDVLTKIMNSKINKVAVISQTTFSVAKFEDFCSVLKEKIEDSCELLIENTICSATELRQKETKELAKSVDAMIVIGGKNSSNTRKLYELAAKECQDTFVVETLNDLEIDVSKYQKIGVMAGASTPKESIDEVVNYLKNFE